MPGLTAPSDYSQDPPRHPSLLINAKAFIPFSLRSPIFPNAKYQLFLLCFSQEPFNAEPPRSALVASYVTPSDFFYKRNHGPIPIVEDINSRYSVFVSGLVERPKQLFMKDIWLDAPKYNVTATLQCAGNRRTAMSKTRTVKGVGWDVSAIGNAVWGGAKLSDVLELVGIPS
ncbi:Sulfite oxidase [Spatholobus suberectus]|nr:Sulfite oxidase [Spatholobus suberectus]